MKGSFTRRLFLRKLDNEACDLCRNLGNTFGDEESQGNSQERG